MHSAHPLRTRRSTNDMSPVVKSNGFGFNAILAGLTTLKMTSPSMCAYTFIVLDPWQRGYGSVYRWVHFLFCLPAALWNCDALHAQPAHARPAWSVGGLVFYQWGGSRLSPWYRAVVQYAKKFDFSNGDFMALLVDITFYWHCIINSMFLIFYYDPRQRQPERREMPAIAVGGTIDYEREGEGRCYCVLFIIWYP